MRKIGLYGGTFNPIHFGHLNLAIEIKETLNLDEVWLIPAARSPFKENGVLPGFHRLKMVEIAIEEIPHFKAQSLELEREAPSYTIDTVKVLLQRYPDVKFHLILGEDALFNFHLWKSYEELSHLAEPLVGCRNLIEVKDRIDDFPLSPSVKEIFKKGFIKTSLMDISATWIRYRLKNQFYCGHLIPSKVLDYIYQYQLYC